VIAARCSFYRGAGRINRLRGTAAPADPYYPEDWIGSATARNGAAPDRLTTLPDGRLLGMAVAEEPERWLGPAHVAMHGPDPAILVKLLDAGERLPLHVHPDQRFADMLAATNRIPVRAGDAIVCPAGLPHAIGRDILLVELQEPTDFSILLEWDGYDIDGAAVHLAARPGRQITWHRRCPARWPTWPRCSTTTATWRSAH
jgi:mannose-6-phosphate isomerase